MIIVVLRLESQIADASLSSLAFHFVIMLHRRDVYSEIVEAFDEAERNVAAAANATGDVSGSVSPVTAPGPIDVSSPATELDDDDDEQKGSGSGEDADEDAEEDAEGVECDNPLWSPGSPLSPLLPASPVGAIVSLSAAGAARDIGGSGSTKFLEECGSVFPFGDHWRVYTFI